MDYYQHVKEESESQWYDSVLLSRAIDCSPEDIIILGERIRTGHPDREPSAMATVQYLFDRLSTEGWDKKIVFYLPSEGFATTYMEYMQIVVKHLLSSPNVKYKNLYYVTGATDIEYNHNLYYKHCLDMNYLPLQIIYNHPFESGSADDAKTRELFHNKKFERKKKILFYNKQPRPHRLAAIAEIMKRNLRSKTYLSFNMDPVSAANLDSVKLLLPKTLEVTEHYIKKLLPELPLNLTLTDNLVFNLLETDLMLFRNSLFSLISETLFHYDVDCSNPAVRDRIHCFPCTFHTEKTWKVIRAKHPFVLLTTPYSLKGLRDMGYKTFHPYIDESYDLITDDHERFYAVMDEVERLANMSDEETNIWLENVQPIAQYNYDLLKTKDYFMTRR